MYVISYQALPGHIPHTSVSSQNNKYTIFIHKASPTQQISCYLTSVATFSFIWTTNKWNPFVIVPRARES